MYVSFHIVFYSFFIFLQDPTICIIIVFSICHFSIVWHTREQQQDAFVLWELTGRSLCRNQIVVVLFSFFKFYYCIKTGNVYLKYTFQSLFPKFFTKFLFSYSDMYIFNNVLMAALCTELPFKPKWTCLKSSIK